MLSIILNLFVYYSSICVFWLFHPFFTVNPFPPIHNLFLSSLFCSIYLLQRSCHTILSYIICVLILGRVSPPIFFFFFFSKMVLTICGSLVVHIILFRIRLSNSCIVLIFGCNCISFTD